MKIQPTEILSKHYVKEYFRTDLKEK